MQGLRNVCATFSKFLRCVYAFFAHIQKCLRKVCAMFAHDLRRVYAMFTHGLRKVFFVCAKFARNGLCQLVSANAAQNAFAQRLRRGQIADGLPALLINSIN